MSFPAVRAQRGERVGGQIAVGEHTRNLAGRCQRSLAEPLVHVVENIHVGNSRKELAAMEHADIFGRPSLPVHRNECAVDAAGLNPPLEPCACLIHAHHAGQHRFCTEPNQHLRGISGHAAVACPTPCRVGGADSRRFCRFIETIDGGAAHAQDAPWRCYWLAQMIRAIHTTSSAETDFVSWSGLNEASSIDFADCRCRIFAITSPRFVRTTTRSPRLILPFGETMMISPCRYTGCMLSPVISSA